MFFEDNEWTKQETRIRLIFLAATAREDVRLALALRLPTAQRYGGAL